MAIELLDPVVASRIAAGEVVERPASALREMLDNSIDSGASRISVWVEEGGLKSITVTDNGSGIAADELNLAFQSHATSKIKTLDDLYSLDTLGFRGEALCSIAAVSRLTLQSDGKKLTCDNGQMGKPVPGSVSNGTTVTMEDLFAQIPARRQFMRRPSTEAADCRKVFIEKALGFEATEFLFFNEGKLELHFPKSSRKDRAVQAMSLTKEFTTGADVIDMAEEEDPVRIYAVAGNPSCYRRDRTQVRIFVNRRIVDNYRLVQAVTSAYSVALPGGVFPYFYLYIEDSPQLVDFNIHPAKRECKLRNESAVYGMVTRMIRRTLLEKSRQETQVLVHPPQGENLFAQPPARPAAHNSVSYAPRTQTPFAAEHQTEHRAEHQTEHRAEHQAEHRSEHREEQFRPGWLESAKQILKDNREKVQEQPVTEKAPLPEWKYLGQAFKTYLLVENGDNILFIDQHAAHERILFEQLKQVPDVQKLMVPYRFETSPDVDDFLVEKSFIYQEMGITLARVDRMVWEIVGIPAACRKNEQEIAAYIKGACGDIETVQKGVFAIIACHSAIRAGDVLDNATAVSLIEKTFELDAMLCPHGRSFTFTISKAQLDHGVGRDI